MRGEKPRVFTRATIPLALVWLVALALFIHHLFT